GRRVGNPRRSERGGGTGPQREGPPPKPGEGGRRRGAMATLTPPERLVGESGFGLKDEPVPLVDLAYRLRTTSEGVRYIQRRAIRKLHARWLLEDLQPAA